MAVLFVFRQSLIAPHIEHIIILGKDIKMSKVCPSNIAAANPNIKNPKNPKSAKLSTPRMNQAGPDFTKVDWSKFLIPLAISPAKAVSASLRRCCIPAPNSES